MSDSPINETPPPNTQPSVRRQPFWFVASITLMICGFLAVVVMRDQIRARWYVRQLRESRDIQQQSYYLSRIAQLGEKAASAVEFLAADPNPQIRLLAISILSRATAYDAVSPLYTLMYDSDQTVRDSAAVALAFLADNGSADALTALKNMLQQRYDGGELGAAAAAAGLARVEASKSAPLLAFALSSRAAPMVRAQAVESLGVLAQACERPDVDSLTILFLKPLVRALGDHGEFAGSLALEREISAVVGFVANSNGSPASQPTTGDHGRRKVSDVARRVLFEATGHNIDSPVSADTPEEDELTQAVQLWYRQHRIRSTTSMPASIPDLETLFRNE